MKNFLTFVLLFVMVFLLFIGKTFYDANLYQTTFSRILDLNAHFTVKLVENFFSEDKDLKKEADETIKKIVLKDLNYDNWLEYTDYIKLSIYPMDITQNLKEELIITLNLSKDEGVIGIYKLQDDKYIYQNKIDALTYIEDVTSITEPLSNRVFIIIEEVLDESFGAFFVDNFVRVYTKIDDSYKEVYRQSFNYEAFYYEKWTNPSIENPKWYRLNEKSVIDFVTRDDGKVAIYVSKNLSKYQSPETEDDSIPNNFTLVTEKSLDITSLWNDNYLYFLQGIGKIKKNSEVVGIIENSYQTVDSLLNSKEKYYKVINKNGKINYIKAEELEILMDYSIAE